jgi:hypothetical protein
MRARREAIRDLYHERQVSLQCAPGGGQDAGLIEAAVYVPGWFIAEELGFDGVGANARHTAANLDRINTANRAVLIEQERPKALEPERNRRQREKQMSALQYAKKFQRALKKIAA